VKGDKNEKVTRQTHIFCLAFVHKNMFSLSTRKKRFFSTFGGTDNPIHPEWLVGIVDTEGYFSMHFNKRSNI
jgi:hypothetical protein